VSTGYEAACPLCKTPRAKGQMRCACNYVFEYERESRPFRRVAGSLGQTSSWTPARIVLVVAGIAAVLASAGVALLAT
jgi:hypothetical protein